MKKIRVLLSLPLAITLPLLSIAPTSCKNNSEPTTRDLFNISDYGQLLGFNPNLSEDEISKRLSGGTLTIPENVTSIKDSAFYNSSKKTTIPPCVKKIEFGGNKVHTIGRFSFKCSPVESVELADSVTEMGQEAFSDSTNLIEINISDTSSLKRIGSFCFYNCPLQNFNFNLNYWSFGSYCFRNTKISEAVVPNTIEELNSGLFNGCINLKKLKICHNSSFNKVPEGFIHGCKNLETFDIDNNHFTSVGSYAFCGCEKIKNFNFKQLIENLIDTEIASFAFSNTTISGEIIFKTTVKAIRESAFEGSSGITSITIPTTTKTIEKNAFGNCSYLSSIDVSSWSKIPEWDSGSFSNISPTGTVKVQLNTDDQWKFDCEWRNKFRYCSKSTMHFDGANKWHINYEGSEQKPELWHISGLGDILYGFNSELTNNQILDLYGDDKESLVFPNSVTTVKSKAFVKDISPTSYESTIPEKIKILDLRSNTNIKTLESKIINLSNIENVYLSNTITSMNGTFSREGDYPFNKIKNVIFPNDSIITSLTGTFNGCSLANISLPNSIKKILDNTFLNCTILNSVKLPNELNELGSHAFCDCYQLEELDLPSTITKIGEYCFEGCSKLKSIVLPESCESVGTSAFYGCTNLESIKIPKNLSTDSALPSTAFRSCHLNSIDLTSFGDDVATWNNNDLFKNHKTSGTVYLKSTVTSEIIEEWTTTLQNAGLYVDGTYWKFELKN